MEKNLNLCTVETPSYLLNIPTSFSSKVPNNEWMVEVEAKGEDNTVDIDVAMAQWFDLYNFLSANSLVSVLPTPKNCELQDLVFVANMGVMITPNDVVISNFTSEPRLGETEVGKKYFELSGVENVHVSPYKFEGEADLKHLKDNIWLGGYGQRTDIRTYEWMEETFGVKIIKVNMKNPKLYHFDCMCFPLTEKAIILCKEECTEEEINEISQYCEIVDVEKILAECGITNNVRCHNFILNSSDIYDLDPILDKVDYQLERRKNQVLEDICIDFGLEPVFINLSEFVKGGALLSCCVMHLNRFSYKVELV